MTFRVLHLASDEKFIPLAMSLYEEAFPKQNDFRVIRIDSEGSHHVTPSERTTIVQTSYFQSDDVSRDLDKCDCLVLHGMLPEFVSAVRRAPAEVLVVWYGWGFEYCKYVEDQIGPILLEDTESLCRALQLRQRARRLLHPSALYKAVLTRGRRLLLEPGSPETGKTNDDSLKAVAARLDVFSVNPAEAPRLRKALPELGAAHEMLSYYTTEDTLDKGPEIMSGPDILLGNSAFPTNNHVEVIKSLRLVDLQGRRVFTPLSYGQSDYAEYITRFGRKALGSSFIAIRDFLKLEEYYETISSCGTVVMNHVRQQALGNISSALYKKAHVVLRSNSALYDFFADLGVRVFPMEELTSVLDGTLKLRSDRADLNRKTMGEYWARASAVKAIRRLEGQQSTSRA